MIPSPTAACLAALVGRLRDVLGQDVVGVYAGGSLALDAYDPQRSDIDVAVVCRRPLAADVKARVAGAVRHEALPCPARGLELVVYAEPAVRAASSAPGYELNLNSGRSMPYHFSPAPGDGAAHWYPIDRAILREHAITLAGPPASSLFAALPRATLLDVLAESVRWHLQAAGGARADDAVLNACRALRFATDGDWVSKPAAGEWARGRVDDAALVDDALEVRTDGGPLDPARVERFLARAASVLGFATADASSHS